MGSCRKLPSDGLDAWESRVKSQCVHVCVRLQSNREGTAMDKEPEQLTADDLHKAIMEVWARRAAVEAGYTSLKEYVDDREKERVA